MIAVLNLLGGLGFTVLGAWRSINAWRATEPAQVHLPDGPRGWMFGSEWWCKGVRSYAAGTVFFTAVALYGLAEVAPGTAWLTGPLSLALGGAGVLLFFTLWNAGWPRALVPPILRDYDCRRMIDTTPADADGGSDRQLTGQAGTGPFRFGEGTEEGEPEDVWLEDEVAPRIIELLDDPGEDRAELERICRFVGRAVQRGSVSTGGSAIGMPPKLALALREQEPSRRRASIATLREIAPGLADAVHDELGKISDDQPASERA